MYIRWFNLSTKIESQWREKFLCTETLMILGTCEIPWHKFELSSPCLTASMNHWLIYSMLPDPPREYHHRCVCGYGRKNMCVCVCACTGSMVMLLPYQHLISTPSSLPVMLSLLHLWRYDYKHTALQPAIRRAYLNVCVGGFLSLFYFLFFCYFYVKT